MRIRLNDPALVPSLLDFLSSGPVGCLVERIGECEIEASLLGSYNMEAHNRFLDQLVNAWEATQPNVVVELGGAVRRLHDRRPAP